MSRFNTRPALHRLGEILTFTVMIGMTAASAATLVPIGKAWTSPASSEASPETPRLPTVVVTAKRSSAG